MAAESRWRTASARGREEAEVHLHRVGVGPLGDRLQPEQIRDAAAESTASSRRVAPGRSGSPASQRACASAMRSRRRSTRIAASSPSPVSPLAASADSAWRSGSATRAKSSAEAGLAPGPLEDRQRAAQVLAARPLPPASAGAAPTASASAVSSARHGALVQHRLIGDGEAGLAQRDEVAGQVAAVHGGDVGRLEHAAGPGGRTSCRSGRGSAASAPASGAPAPAAGPGRPAVMKPRS